MAIAQIPFSSQCFIIISFTVIVWPITKLFIVFSSHWHTAIIEHLDFVASIDRINHFSVSFLIMNPSNACFGVIINLFRLSFDAIGVFSLRLLSYKYRIPDWRILLVIVLINQDLQSRYHHENSFHVRQTIYCRSHQNNQSRIIFELSKISQY